MIMEGFAAVFTDPLLILMVAAGTLVGIIFGAIPGLTATMAVTICLPMTYAMSDSRAIALLMALYIGGISGGLISSILLNIPGTPASMVTAFDGAPMARKGQAGKALGTGIFYSFLGTVFGLLAMVLISPYLASLALKFSPFEYCALAIFSLSLVIGLTGKDMLKGLGSALLGVMLATIGISKFDSVLRYDFGSVNMQSGFTQLVVLIGLYAIPEVVGVAMKVHRPKETFETNAKIDRIHGLGFSLKEFVAQLKNFFIAAILGTGIGILPGIGGAMIPLLTLGIPGDGVTAILLGSLIIHGVAPGPTIFEKNGALMYAIYLIIALSALFMMIFMYGGLKGFIKILSAPQNFLMPIILAMCCVGAFGSANRIFDVWCLLAFGLVAVLIKALKMPAMPVAIGFILGPIFEEYLRRAEGYIYKPTRIDGVKTMVFKWEELLNHPIALVILAVTVVVIIVSIRTNAKAVKREAAAQQEAAQNE